MVEFSLEIIDSFLQLANSKIGVALTLTSATLGPAFLFKRVGFRRALVVGISSLFRGPPVKSQRTADVANIREVVHRLLAQSPDQFLVVRGPKGIGKTIAIENALAHTCGVCYAGDPIQPGNTKDYIVDKALTGFTTIGANPWIDKDRVARRVIMWHRIFFLGRKPIMVISAQERKKGEPYAQIAEAARDLAKKGLRVIVDTSDGALTNQPLTLRELYIEMEPMSLETINQMPELVEFIKFLKEQDIYNEVLFVLY